MLACTKMSTFCHESVCLFKRNMSGRTQIYTTDPQIKVLGLTPEYTMQNRILYAQQLSFSYFIISYFVGVY